MREQAQVVELEPGHKQNRDAGEQPSGKRRAVGLGCWAVHCCTRYVCCQTSHYKSDALTSIATNTLA